MSAPECRAASGGSPYLAGLNPAQLEAVTIPGGPALVLAGAGSGKTRVITHRIAHLIADRGIDPWRIVAVTFTNKAAAELRNRVQRLLGPSEPPWVSTFHSACVRILRREIEVLGFTSSFAIYDDQDQERLLKECLRELAFSEQLLTARAAANVIDAAKNAGLGPADYDRSDIWSERAARVYELYQQRLQQANALDFGDLLLQIVLHAQIATEAGEFDIGQVLSSINTKIIRRHPHVFGELEVKDAREVLLSWEKLKQEERGEGVSILSSVPDNMPALAYSQTLQQRAARVGFDWKELKGVLEKLTEELEELEVLEELVRLVRFVQLVVAAVLQVE